MTDVLIVEDDPILQGALSETMALAGLDYQLAKNGKVALEMLATLQPKVVLSDIRMDELDGKGLLKEIQKKYPQLAVILMTAYGSIEDAVNAIQLGAVDYLQKPFVAQALIEKINRYTHPAFVQGEQPIAIEQQTKALYAMALKVAQSEVNVLISGESGTGKEVLAQYIHNQSKRAKQPFIAINCAAIPEQMLEATLFGYEKGAFTGAVKSTPGKFEQAQGGTLLLDEISEMSLPLQAKLLRVLQEKEVERIGGQKLVKLDVRVISTTNRQLLDEVKDGRFREDLYYRLNVFPLQCLPLRERKEEILALAEHLIHKHCKKNQSVIPEISKQAQKMLIEYQWPGNVRELENIIQRALVLQTENKIDPEHLQLPTTLFEKKRDDQDIEIKDLQKHEFELIEKTLSSHQGNRTKTAMVLGISERTLRYKLAKMREEGYVI